MMNRDEGGQLSDFIGGGTVLMRGGHKAHRGDPPPLGETLRKTLLCLVSNLVGIDITRLSSKECTLLLYGNNYFSFLVNRGVIEETIKYIKNTTRFE